MELGPFFVVGGLLKKNGPNAIIKEIVCKNFYVFFYCFFS